MYDARGDIESSTLGHALAADKHRNRSLAASADAIVGALPTSLADDTPGEFLLQLRHALATTPAPLTPAERRRLSWEGATDRFLDALTNSTPGETLPSLSDHSARWFHQSLQRASFGDAMRRMSKAGPVALQSWLSSPDVRDLGVTEIVEQSLVHSPPSAD